VFALRDQGLTRGEGALYAVGRLALFTPGDRRSRSTRRWKACARR